MDEPNVRQPVLAVNDLCISYRSGGKDVCAVDGVTFDVAKGEVLGVVGESGSGKSTVALALLGLVGAVGGRVGRGTVEVDGRDLFKMSKKERRYVRGKVVSLVFQDPMQSFNPVLTVGAQIVETIEAHESGISRADAYKRAKGLLERVSMPDAQNRLSQYPHEYSGGMLQRAMIAVAIANEPSLIVADEPSTALDVTVQAQILDLLREVVADSGAGLIIVTHNLDVVAELADRVMVMYAGKVVELAGVFDLFSEPRHPYTAALLRSRPTLDAPGAAARFATIPGSVRSAAPDDVGCPFASRCGLVRDRCTTETPALQLAGDDRWSACHFHSQVTKVEEVPA